MKKQIIFMGLMLLAARMVYSQEVSKERITKYAYINNTCINGITIVAKGEVPADDFGEYWDLEGGSPFKAFGESKIDYPLNPQKKNW